MLYPTTCVRLGYGCLCGKTISGFSRRHGYPHSQRLPGGRSRTVRFGSGGVLHCPPRLLHPSTRNSVCGRRFHSRVTASLRGASDGMLTVSSICIASRLIIRHRLTPGRTTLPGNPWSYGGGESHPPYRYLCLHLLFQKLQETLAGSIHRRRNAPLPTPKQASHGFGARLHTRLLSMPDSSTSELLRTL